MPNWLIYLFRNLLPKVSQVLKGDNPRIPLTGNVYAFTCPGSIYVQGGYTENTQPPMSGLKHNLQGECKQTQPHKDLARIYCTLS